jgi:fused signal recognition particle receptor
MFRSLFRKVKSVLTGRPSLSDEEVGQIEEQLILSDVGPGTAANIVGGMRELLKTADKGELDREHAAQEALKRVLAGMLQVEIGSEEVPGAKSPPILVIVVGVNGTGKTTSIAKLAHMHRSQGKKVLLAAADTFRAAAIDQLRIWAGRVGAEFVAHKEGADPAACVFDAIEAARARGIDVVIADTAGRQHTKRNLMEELQKVVRVGEKALGRPPDDVLLVLDATTGQNAIAQARTFSEAIGLTGIILAKTDGTASGGAVVTICSELQIPIRYLGFGEKAGDLRSFEVDAFVEQLVAGED